MTNRIFSGSGPGRLTLVAERSEERALLTGLPPVQGCWRRTRHPDSLDVAADELPEERAHAELRLGGVERPVNAIARQAQLGGVGGTRRDLLEEPVEGASREAHLEQRIEPVERAGGPLARSHGHGGEPLKIRAGGLGRRSPRSAASAPHRAKRARSPGRGEPRRDSRPPGVLEPGSPSDGRMAAERQPAQISGPRMR